MTMKFGIDRLLADPALRAELREKGLVRAKQFSWEKSVARTLEIYKEVGGRGKGEGGRERAEGGRERAEGGGRA